MAEVVTDKGADGFRVQVQQNLAVVVKDGRVWLEAGIMEPHVQRVAVTHPDELHAALCAAREHVIIADNRWYKQRLADMAEHGRRVRGET